MSAELQVYQIGEGKSYLVVVQGIQWWTFSVLNIEDVLPPSKCTPWIFLIPYRQVIASKTTRNFKTILLLKNDVSFSGDSFLLRIDQNRFGILNLRLVFVLRALSVQKCWLSSTKLNTKVNAKSYEIKLLNLKHIHLRPITNQNHAIEVAPSGIGTFMSHLVIAVY